MRIIECVPNISEGRDASVIERFAAFLRESPGVRLLNIDPGYAANRTVYTYIGEPERVAEATFGLFRLAAALIDMRSHSGTHPRIGAVDVCPLVPVSGVTLGECAELARDLSARVGSELGIPVYCYEAAAYTPERRNLAECRRGEYEGLPEKLARPEWKPDFGPSLFDCTVAKSGLSVIGARKFLIAINFNLANSLHGNAAVTAEEMAAAAKLIAGDVRESGRIAGGARIAGPLKKCKAIGWYIKEYGRAQVSMNLTDTDVTPLHTVYDTVCAAARARGAEVTGSELIGLIPGQVLAGAGRHYAGSGADLSDEEFMELAVKKLTLDDIGEFDIRSRVIEYFL